MKKRVVSTLAILFALVTFICTPVTVSSSTTPSGHDLQFQKGVRNTFQSPSGDPDSFAPGRRSADMLNTGGILNFPHGLSGVLDARGSELASGANESPVFIPRAPGDEKWQAGFGPNGIHGAVYALATDGNDHIFMGGIITTAGLNTPNNIVEWNVASGTWSALGYGLNGRVTSLAWDDVHQVLYAGGAIRNACADATCTTQGEVVNGVARWDGSQWTGLANGVNGWVYSLALAGNGNLYVGGSFNGICTVPNCTTFDPAGDVAMWYGNKWTALAQGVSGGMWQEIDALALDGAGALYVGGVFTTAGTVTANNIAMWDSASRQWQALKFGLWNQVYALAWDTSTGSLIAGGDFNAYCGDIQCSYGNKVTMNHITRWNPSTSNWASLSDGVDNRVSAITLDASGILYAGGYFGNYCLDYPCNYKFQTNYIARWTPASGGSWSSLGGMDYAVLALGLAGGSLYVGGGFATVGNVSVTGIARWDGSNWYAFGSGNGIVGDVTSMLADGHGFVYVGGSFLKAGGITAYYIAEWNGTSWSALGNGFNYEVDALAWDDNHHLLYAAGAFRNLCAAPKCATWGTQVNGIAVWDGSTWSGLGYGFNAIVYALALDNSGNLYAGGGFSQLCGDPTCNAATNTPMNEVARWDGKAWSALGKGLNGFDVKALVIDRNGALYAGGDFQFICGASGCPANGAQVNSVARWDGASWSALDKGLLGEVDALAFDKDGVLYAGGRFQYVCGSVDCKVVVSQVNHLAKWNSAQWTGLGYGVNDNIWALAADAVGNLFVGGDFSFACVDTACASGSPAISIARWNGSALSTLGTGMGTRSTSVKSLAWQYGMLSVGGSFSTAGDKISASFAQYLDNHAPSLVTIIKSGRAGAPLAFSAADFAGAMNDFEGESLVKIQILLLPAHGNLQLDRTPVTLNQEIPAGNLSTLAFMPATGWTGRTGFRWNGNDGNAYAVNGADVTLTITPNYLYLPYTAR